MRWNGSRASIRNLIGFLVLLTASNLCLSAQNEDRACGTKAEQQQKEVQLRLTMAKMLRIIRAKDASAFLGFVDKGGFAVWGGILSPSDIKREFLNKQGLYCLLISTECIASTRFPNGAYINLDKWQISYREWLEQNSSTKIEIEMFFGGEDAHCTANLSIRRIKKLRPAEETFELGFNYRSGKWVLRSTPAYPEGTACLTPQRQEDQKKTEA
jgi:hypothetical protein